jgi:hypothetical protein
VSKHPADLLSVGLTPAHHQRRTDRHERRLVHALLGCTLPLSWKWIFVAVLNNRSLSKIFSGLPDALKPFD